MGRDCKQGSNVYFKTHLALNFEKKNFPFVVLSSDALEKSLPGIREGFIGGQELEAN